ncbi:MAG: HAMP domain-containing sensor histidine kinase [Candidatus Saganbacteria bacterium]|nr:HAMP domain-containing sensor histidine kinase [Candidatus Saganbacteria bacterium]
MTKKENSISPEHIEAVERRWQERKEASTRKSLEEQKIEAFTTEFMSTISHELKTPLTVIQEGVLLLLEEKIGKVPPKQVSCLNLVLQNTKRMLRMVEDLLDISRINLGKARLNKKVTDLVDVVKKVHELFLPFSQKEGKELKTNLPSHPIYVYADEDRISQVLHNLLGNAFKFTPPEGQIVVEIFLVGENVRLAVADNGCGIPKDHLETIFDKFHQLDHGYGPGAKGLGLGLSICRDIIVMLGGRIWVESEVGRGSRFIFELPILPPYFEKLLKIVRGKTSNKKAVQEIRKKGIMDILMHILENKAVEVDMKEAILGLYQENHLLKGVVPNIFEHIEDFMNIEIKDHKGKSVNASSFKEAFLMAYMEKNMGAYNYKGKPIYDFGTAQEKRLVLMEMVKGMSSQEIEAELLRIQD